MGIIYKGNCQFEESREPRYSKNEWGTDVVVRTYQGAKIYLTAFLATLYQGLARDGMYLQTWEVDDNNVFPSVSLSYKGFLKGLPQPDGQNSVSQRTMSKSTEIDNESVAKDIKGENLSGDETHKVTAIREIFAMCPQTVWRYITNTKPNGPSFSVTNSTASPKIRRSRITARWKDQEKTWSGNAPSPLVSALAMQPGYIDQGHQAQQIIGSPWWECQDTVSYEYIGDNN